MDNAGRLEKWRTDQQRHSHQECKVAADSPSVAEMIFTKKGMPKKSNENRVHGVHLRSNWLRLNKVARPSYEYKKELKLTFIKQNYEETKLNKYSTVMLREMICQLAVELSVSGGLIAVVGLAKLGKLMAQSQLYKVYPLSIGQVCQNQGQRGITLTIVNRSGGVLDQGCVLALGDAFLCGGSVEFDVGGRYECVLGGAGTDAISFPQLTVGCL